MSKYVIETEFIASVDDASFKNAKKKIARDTWKELDPLLLKKLKLNIIDFENKIKEVKRRLKDPNLDKDTRLNLRLQLQDFKSDLTEARRKLQNFKNTWDESLSRLQSKFNGIWKSIISNFVNPISLWIWAILWLWKAITNASKTAISFESAFAWVKKTFDDTAEWYKILEKWLVDLSKRLPLTFEELSWIAEVAWQLWVTGRADLLKFTEVAAWLWIATNLSAEEAATSLKRFSDVLWVPIDQIDRLWSSLVSLGNNFAANEQEILWFAEKAQTAGVVSSLTATQILWLSTALVSSWIKAEAWGTAIVKVFAKINKAALEWWPWLEKFAKVAWKTSEEFAKDFRENAWTAFTDFMKWLSVSWQEGAIVLDKLGINSSRAQQAFLALWGNVKTLEDAMNNSNEAFDMNTALQDEVQKRLDTTESKLLIAKNMWRSLSSELWKWFNSIRVPVFQWFTTLMNWFITKIKLAFVIWKNVFHNLWVAVSNMWVSIKVWLNASITLLEWFINKAIDWIIKLAKTIPGAGQLFWDLKADIKLWSIDVSEQKKSYRDLSEWTQSVLWSIEDTNSQILDSTKKTIEEQIKGEYWLLDELKAIDEEKARSWKSSSKARLDANKQAEKELKDKIKFYEEEWKALDKLSDEKLKKTWETAKVAFKAVEDWIKNSKNAIEWFDKEITRINDELTNLESWSSADIATRAVSIQEEIDKLNEKRKITQLDKEEQQKLIDLQKELKLAKSETTKEDIVRAELIANESETERLIRTAQEKEESLKKELEAVQAQKDEELVILEWLENAKKQLLDEFSVFLNKKVEEEKTLADSLIKKRNEVARARAKAGAWWWSIAGARAEWWPVTSWKSYLVWELWPEIFTPASNWNIIPNNQITNNANINVNANVSNNIDIDYLWSELARKIQLAQKNIF